MKSSLAQCHRDTFSPGCCTQAPSSILALHITQSRLISAHFWLSLNYLTQQASQSASCPWPHTVPILPASTPVAWLPFPAACKEPTCLIRMCLPAVPATGTYRRGPGQACCTPPNWLKEEEHLNLLQKEVQAPASPHSFTCRACPNLQVGSSLQTGTWEEAKSGQCKSAGGIDPSGSLDADPGLSLNMSFFPSLSRAGPSQPIFSSTWLIPATSPFNTVYPGPAKLTKANSIRPYIPSIQG